MSARVRPLVLFAPVAGAAAVVATVGWSRRWDAVTITLVLVAVWGAAVSAIDAITLWRARPPAPPVAGTRPVTFVVVLGDENHDIARTSLVLAAGAGPVVVVSTRHHALLDELGDLGIREHVAPSIGQALQDAAAVIATDAVLVLSGSAFPLRDTSALAAAQMTCDVGWVTGRAPVFNNDRFAPGERELIGACARAAARDLGLVTWEPDATIVRTSLLRAHQLPAGRPNGAWLRERSAEGWRGVVFAGPVARRAAPADAPVFWPMETRRLRGAVADLADAATRGAWRARLPAVGALSRELYAYSIALWLLVVVLIGHSGTFPFSVSPLVLFGLHGSVAVARWISSRLAYCVGLHPVDEARAAAYDLPGSLLALPSVLSRRVRPLRVPIPDQPLLVAALLLTVVTTIPLLDRRATSGAAGLAVALTLGALGATWVFALRAVGAGAWDRATYRLGVDFPARINGCAARVFDASPSGLAVVGAPSALGRGEPAEVSVAFDPAHVSVARGRVTDVRRSSGRAAIGMALDLDPAQRVSWIRSLFAATGVTSGSLTASTTIVARPHLVLDREPPGIRQRAVTVLRALGVGAVSLVVLAALLLSFLGYRPMVVRSGSMAPSLRVGDVVVTEPVRVERIRAGEIVSFVDALDRSQLVTHRVQRVRRSGDTVEVESKGDANAEPERWTARLDTRVGRVVWTIPSVGRLLVVLGESATRRLLLGVTAVVVVVAVVAARRRAGSGVGRGDSRGSGA